MKKFIYFITNSIKYWYHRMLDLHRQIKEINVDELPIKAKSPYDLLADWFGEIIQYGLLLMFIYVILFGVNHWLKAIALIFAFGIIRWITLDTIKEISKAVKEK